ncbi:MAG TPA: EAL domain-containing protein, partial [Deinococcales bacterium]|nr:EAL domain-containing protein [Deinococcales bacterium]
WQAAAFLAARVLEDEPGERDAGPLAADVPGDAALAVKALAFQHAAVGLVVQSLNGEQLAVNETAARLLGNRGNAVEFPSGDEPGREWPLFVDLLRGRREAYSVERPLGNGATGRLTVTTAETPTGDLVTVHAVTDVTDTAQVLRDLEDQAFRDQLTGLPNRRLFEDRLAVSLRQAERQDRTDAIVFLDLDRLKLVNDTLGHAAGDALLRQVAGRLTDGVRKGDTVARLGGDEFTLLLPGLDPGAVDALMRKLLDRLAQPFTLAGHPVNVTGSIGVALYPTHARTPEELLNLADAALYRAKAAGRNTYRLAAAPGLSPPAAGLGDALDAALERGEFALAYQPQLDLRTGRVVGMEALLRWRHPEMGNVPPARFIPTLEATGGILRVGGWVLDQAILQAARWRDRQLRVSVNVSSLQLDHPSFGPQVRERLERHDLSGEHLELEVSQAALLRVDGLTPTLNALRDLGVGLAVDDFAADDASLDIIRRLPVTSVNVPQGFVRQASGAAGRGVLRRVIRVAEHIGLRTLAEGLERQSELDALREIGCDLGQGYLFAQPLTPEAAERYSGLPEA